MGLTGKPIVVIGMHRSGTSSVANALHKLGLDLGESGDLLEPNDFNSEGYWEHVKVLELDNHSLEAFGLSYERLEPITESWLELPQAKRVLSEIESVLSTNFGGKALWGWKEPRSSVLLPFYNEAFKALNLDPTYVICVRGPLGVSGSLSKREGFTTNHAMGLWLSYTLASLKFSLGYNRSVVIYENFLSDPRPALADIVDSVEGWKPDEASWTAAVATLRKDMNHNAASTENLDGHFDLVNRTYALCVEAAQNNSGFRSGLFDTRIGELWSEFLELTEVYSMSPRQATWALFWQTNALNYNQQLYRPRQGWQTLKLAVPAPSSHIVGAMFYDLPSAVWIRKATWHHSGGTEQATIKPGRHAKLNVQDGMSLIAVGRGQEQAILTTPSSPGPYEFEVELYVESQADMILGFINYQAQELSRLRKQNI